MPSTSFDQIRRLVAKIGIHQHDRMTILNTAPLTVGMAANTALATGAFMALRIDAIE